MSSSISLSIFAVLVTAACWTDLKERRIPNWISLSGILAGIALALIFHGVSSAGLAVLGCVVGMVCFLPLYALGKMGAGDVKMLGMAGAFLGPEGAVWAALWSSIAGGVLAVLWILMTVGIRQGIYWTVGAISNPLPSSSASQDKSSDSLGDTTIPYALAIATGSLVAVYQLSLP